MSASRGIAHRHNAGHAKAVEPDLRSSDSRAPFSERGAKVTLRMCRPGGGIARPSAEGEAVGSAMVQELEAVALRLFDLRGFKRCDPRTKHPSPKHTSRPGRSIATSPTRKTCCRCRSTGAAGTSELRSPPDRPARSHWNHFAWRSPNSSRRRTPNSCGAGSPSSLPARRC